MTETTGLSIPVKSLLTVLSLVIFGGVSSDSQARVHAPRVVSEHNADAYSMKTFASYPRWQSLQGDAKAWEMFNYLTDYDTGLYPMGAGAFEGAESLYEYSLVRDPVKLINVYSVGYCDVFGPVMAGIWEDAGLGRARTIDLEWNDHVTTEVFYNNDWHLLDLDLRAAFRKSDSTLASLSESQFNSALWNQPNSPRFFPLDYLPEVQEAFEQSDPLYRYGTHQSGHTMDYVLRQGETFTRWWQPQGGRWLHHPNLETEPFVMDIIETPPRGPKSKHESFSKHTHGNGRFVYQPNLTRQSTDFADGIYDSNNVQVSDNGLTLTTPGTGYAVFEVRTPYVIVPLVGNTGTTADDREASVIEVDASGATYGVSLDNGITWQPVTGSVIDLTRQVAGRYQYLFRVTLQGTPETTILRTLNMTTWVQLAPASLPSLRQGSNQMSVRSGDHYGLQTRVMEVKPDTSNRADFYRHLVVEPENHDPSNDTQRVTGPFVVAVPAPPQTKIAWFSAGASYHSYQLEQAPLTGFTMAYATDLPFAYNDFYTADLPSDMQHWHTNAQAEVQLNTPADAVYLQYNGDPAVNTVQIYAHVLDNTPRTASPLTVTHNWLENGQPKEFTTTTDFTSNYSIDVSGVPTDISMELAVASQVNELPDNTPQDDGASATTPASTSTGAISTGSGNFSALCLLLLIGLMACKTADHHDQTRESAR
jgi:hypothetical protein